MLIARLECHHHGGAPRPLPRAPQGDDFGVRATGRLRATHPGDVAVGIENDRTDRRVGIRRALALLALANGQPHGGLCVHRAVMTSSAWRPSRPDGATTR